VLSMKRYCLRILVFVGFGTVMLMICCFLPGCGSDSKIENSGVEKNKKVVVKTGKNPPIKLLSDQKENVMQGMEQKRMKDEIFPGAGITQQELEAKAAADQEKFKSQRNKMFPGITQEELEAKAAADQEKFKSQRNKMFPGITQQELEAKAAADQEKFKSQRNKMFPGITQGELEARAARPQVKPEETMNIPPSLK
jgi:hypothetical protein